MSIYKRTLIPLFLGLTGCATLPSTLPLQPVRSLGIAPEIRVEKPRLTNEYMMTGLLIMLAGEVAAASDTKDLRSRLETKPTTLADFFREEFTAQVSQSGRFTIVAPESAEAVAALAITEISLGKPVFEDRDRPIVRIEVTIADRSGRRLWRGTSRVDNQDMRTPLYPREVYLKDPEVAFTAYTTAIRMAVVDMVRHFTAGRPKPT